MALRWSDIHRASFAHLPEAGTLVSVLIVTGGVLLFAELMEMVGDEPHAFDRAVLLAFRSPTDVSFGRSELARACFPRYHEFGRGDGPEYNDGCGYWIFAGGREACRCRARVCIGRRRRVAQHSPEI
jgi:hypothetical protein